MHPHEVRNGQVEHSVRIIAHSLPQANNMVARTGDEVVCISERGASAKRALNNLDDLGRTSVSLSRERPLINEPFHPLRLSIHHLQDD